MAQFPSRSPGSHKWASQLDEIFKRCEGAYSDLTLSGYRTDLEIFARWCVVNSVSFLPARPSAVAAFFDHQLETCTYATIRRRASAIKFVHALSDLPSPIAHSEVYLSIRRAARRKGRRPRQVLGLTRRLLDEILDACPNSLTGVRDAALLSLGYDTMCRSSELSWMRVQDLRMNYNRVNIPRSKNDPFGDGRIASMTPSTQKILALWLNRSHIKVGPLFRGLHTGSISNRHLDTSSIRRIVKSSARRAGLISQAEQLSGHSMRVGAAQDLLNQGEGILTIMTAGGWKSQEVVARYVERAWQVDCSVDKKYSPMPISESYAKSIKITLD